MFHFELERKLSNLNQEEKNRFYTFMNSPQEVNDEDFCSNMKFVLSTMLDAYEPDILRYDLISSLDYYKNTK